MAQPTPAFGRQTTPTPLPTNETHWEFTDYNQRIFIACLFIIISILGMVGNLMVIIAVNMSRKLQTATNVFVLNTSCVDFLNCLVLPFNAVSMLSRGGWPLSPGVCALCGGVTAVCLGATVINLALIAFNRAYLIKNPRTNYRKMYTPVKLGVMVFLAWFFPIVAFAVPPALGIGRLGYSKAYKVCFWDDAHELYYINDYIAMITFLASFVVIVVCYLTIYVHVRRHNQRLMVSYARSMSKPGKGNGEHPNGAACITEKNHNSTLDTKGRRSHKREIQITKNLFTVVCAFFICVLPYPITLTIPIMSAADIYAGVMLMANSCVNPMIYSFKHPHFKLVFKHMLHCRYDEVPDPTTQLKFFRSSDRQGSEKQRVSTNGRGGSRYESGSTR